MIWLASYPRSGNTFFRNILFEVYGITSTSYHLGKNKPLDPDFANYPIVKTHLLPFQLPLEYRSLKSIYLVRDGRDAAVSLAHHRKDIKQKGSSFLKNLFEIIIGIGSGFPGGWSRHVNEWGSHSDIIIKYEDLIKNPRQQVERLGEIMVLPTPNWDKLPTFESQKKGDIKYTIERSKTDSEKKELTTIFFRRGISGSYKDEMPKVLQLLFWIKHRRQMKKFNYY